MDEQAQVFIRLSASTISTEGIHAAVDPPTTLGEGNKKPQQPRQLLSCTKCRERKVKCDRTKPCTACCARGAPKECKFVAEGGDYAPIQQSYEIRKLRAENLRLKERLRACKIPIEGDDSDPAASPDSYLSERTSNFSHKRRVAKQRRFHNSEWSDSIYFGSPGLANVVVDWASINLEPTSTQSLAHLMPRGPEMYAATSSPPYPFATLFKATPNECIPELLTCLPPREEIFDYLDVFRRRVYICAFPCIPPEITKCEVERFLSNVEYNARLCPDMLALLFAALALGAQYSTSHDTVQKWKPSKTNEVELQRGNVYLAAAMQALRLASFMHKPSLLGIQALMMIGPFLTNSGRFLDAWTLFGTTIRLAHSMGLHRNPKYLDPAPPTQRECSLRQTLWWWMLHMDQEYSMTLGRPLGISGLGDCPPPLELTTDPWMLRFGEFVNHFTLLARQILSSDRLTNSKIDEFTDLLRSLLETMPEILQFDKTWAADEWPQRKDKPEWPLDAMAAVFYSKTQTYLIILNRQRLEKQRVQYASQNTSPLGQTPPSCVHPVGPPSSDYPSTNTTRDSLRGRPLVLSSAEDLLTAFVFLHKFTRAALTHWTTGQQAFNACMILLLDALETNDLTRIGTVNAAFVVFKDLQEHGVHELANLAVDRISWGLTKLRRMDQGFLASATGLETDPSKCRAGGDIAMENTAESEATHQKLMHDTIMGNTGMLLLEDPGLQSFIPEAFAPLTWASGTESHDRSFTPHQQLPEEHSIYHKPSKYDSDRHDDNKSAWSAEGSVPSAARSSEHLQGGRGSAAGSAPLRYATFGTAPFSSQQQPQGLLSPTSSLTTSAGSMVEQQNHAAKADFAHPPPLFVRHHSYPSVRRWSNGPDVGSRCDQDTDDRHPLVRKGREKNLPHVPSSEPHLQATCNSAIRATAAEQFNLDVQPTWAARPAVPIPTVPGPVLDCSHHMSGWRQTTLPFMQQNMRTPTWQYTMPFNLTSASGESTTATAKQYEVEEWRR